MSKWRWVKWYALALVIVYGLMPGISYAFTVILEKMLALRHFGSPATNLLFALPVILFGMAWMGWSSSTLRWYGKGHAIHAFGRAPQPTQRLCKVGPYQYTQNPMYFGWLAVMVGFGIALGSIVLIASAFLIWVPFIYLYLPRYEWPGLKSRFGEEWLDWHLRTPVILPSMWRRWRPEYEGLGGPGRRSENGEEAVDLYLNKTKYAAPAQPVHQKPDPSRFL